MTDVAVAPAIFTTMEVGVVPAPRVKVIAPGIVPLDGVKENAGDDTPNVVTDAAKFPLPVSVTVPVLPVLAQTRVSAVGVTVNESGVGGASPAGPSSPFT